MTIYNEASFYEPIVKNVLEPCIQDWRVRDNPRWIWKIIPNTKSYPIEYTITMRKYAGFMLPNSNSIKILCELRFYRSDVRIYFQDNIRDLTHNYSSKYPDSNNVILNGNTPLEIGANLKKELDTTVSEVVKEMKFSIDPRGKEALWTALFRLACVIEHFNQSTNI